MIQNLWEIELSRYEEQCIEYICQILNEPIEVCESSPEENRDNFILVENATATEIWLKKFDIRIIPFLMKLENLRKIRIEKTIIRSFPITLLKHPSLEEIKLMRNRMEVFPPFNEKNTKLRTLWVNENCLKSLPRQLENLLALEELYVANNKFEEYPEVMGKIKSLRILSTNKQIEKREK